MSAARKLVEDPSASPLPVMTPPVFHTVSPQELKPASPGKRVVALFIDGVVSGVLSKVLVALFTVVSKPSTEMVMMFTYMVSLLVVPIAYWCLLPMEFGATVGKKAMGLRIVSKDTSLEPSMGAYFLREGIGRMLSLILLGAGYIMAFVRSDRRSLHDMIAGTRVVDDR